MQLPELPVSEHRALLLGQVSRESSGVREGLLPMLLPWGEGAEVGAAERPGPGALETPSSWKQAWSLVPWGHTCPLVAVPRLGGAWRCLCTFLSHWSLEIPLCLQIGLSSD